MIRFIDINLRFNFGDRDLTHQTRNFVKMKEYVNVCVLYLTKLKVKRLVVLVESEIKYLVFVPFGDESLLVSFC